MVSSSFLPISTLTRTHLAETSDRCSRFADLRRSRRKGEAEGGEKLSVRRRGPIKDVGECTRATYNEEEEGYKREDIRESLVDSVGLRIRVGGGGSLVGVLVADVVELGH